MIENTKLIKTCRTTRKFVKVMRIMCYVAIALFFLCSAAFFIPVFDNVSESVIVQEDITGTEIAYTRNEVIVKGVWAISAVAIGSVIMRMCEKVLGSVDTENTPFVAENVKRLKTASILMACLSVVPSFFSQIAQVIVGGREIMLDVDLGNLIVALVIWSLALIFEYGVSLQQREDETL